MCLSLKCGVALNRGLLLFSKKHKAFLAGSHCSHTVPFLVCMPGIFRIPLTTPLANFISKKIDVLQTCNHPKCCWHWRTTHNPSLSAETGDYLSHLYLFHPCLSTRCGGTVGAILTCPLEVVKTRLQSSSITLYVSEVQLSTVNGASVARMSPPGPLHCLKWVYFSQSRYQVLHTACIFIQHSNIAKTQTSVNTASLWL